MNKIRELKKNKNRNIIVNTNYKIKQLLESPYTDRTDDEIDDEQSDTTDMSALERDQRRNQAEQRRNQARTRLKILKQYQRLSRLPITF